MRVCRCKVINLTWSELSVINCNNICDMSKSVLTVVALTTCLKWCTEKSPTEKSPATLRYLWKKALSLFSDHVKKALHQNFLDSTKYKYVVF